VELEEIALTNDAETNRVEQKINTTIRIRIRFILTPSNFPLKIF